MEGRRPNYWPKHWHWERERDGLVWLTFDKQGESANTFSREALEELSRALDAIRTREPEGAGDPLGQGRLHRRRRCRGVHALQVGRRGARLRQARLGCVAAAARPALPHHRDGERLLHGRRHRARARLPLPRGARRPEGALRPAGGDARHHAGVARRAVAAEAGRPRGGDGHAAHRQVRGCKAGETHRIRRPGGAAADFREYGAHRYARGSGQQKTCV